MLYKGIFDARCWCGNYVHTHGVLCADCAAHMDAEKDDDVVVCAGCGSVDDGFGFANGTCYCCGSGLFTIEAEGEV